jgi:putative lipase involved disintegration of autophagic bodies
MKIFKCLNNDKFIIFISFFLLLLRLSYALEIIDPNTLGQVETLANGEPTTVSLRHVFHHGSTKFPKLFRRLDLTDSKVRAYEIASGTPYTYTVMGINGTGIEYEKDNAIEEFRNKSRNELMSTKLDWRDKFKYLPDIKNWGTLINLAKMTYNAYVKPTDEDWYDLGEKYNIVRFLFFFFLRENL